MLHKFRHPLSIEDAGDVAAGYIGYHGIAAITGKSEQLARKWFDRDDERQIPLSAAIEIDKAIKHEFGATPFLDAMSRILAAEEFRGEHVCIVDATLDLHAAMGRLTEAIKAAKSPTGPGGRRLTTAERKSVAHLIRATRRHLDAIERACASEAEPALKVVGGAE